MQVSIEQIQKRVSQELKPFCDNSAREAQMLLSAYLKKDELWLITNSSRLIDYTPKLDSMVKRRVANEPLEYILNTVSFYSQNFYIDSRALIPRPETELLIDKVAESIKSDSCATICEVGVGSGVISILLSQKLPEVKIVAVDISPQALEVAKINIDTFNLQDRIELINSDLLDSVDHHIDLLVSNPPYIAKSAPLEPNLAYEPDRALFGGERGDEIIELLLEQVYQREIPLFICEIGYDQKDSITHMLHKRSYSSLEFYKDLAGFDRGFVLSL